MEEEAIAAEMPLAPSASAAPRPQAFWRWRWLLPRASGRKMRILPVTAEVASVMCGTTCWRWPVDVEDLPWARRLLPRLRLAAEASRLLLG